MAERVEKQILQIVQQYVIEGSPDKQLADVKALTEARDKAAKGSLAFVEADKQLERAQQQAGVAIESATKKTTGLTEAIVKSGKAIKEVGALNQGRNLFETVRLDQFNKAVKDFEKNIIVAGKSGKDGFKQVDAEVEKLVKTIENLKDTDQGDAIKNLAKEAERLGKLIANPTQRLRELMRLINTTEDPELLKTLQVQAAKLDKQLQNTRDLVNALASDSFLSDTAIEGITVATGAMATFQGLTALATDDSKAFQEATAKAAGALALLQGVQSLTNALKKEDNIITRIQIITQRVYAAAVGNSEGAMKALRVTALATGAVLTGGLLIAIVALVQNFDRIKDALGLGVNPELVKFAELSRAAAAAAQEELNVLKQSEEFKRSLGKSEEESLKDTQKAQEDKVATFQDAANKEFAILEDMKKKRAENLKDAQETNFLLRGLAVVKLGIGISEEDVKAQQKLSDDASAAVVQLGIDIQKSAADIKKIEEKRTEENKANLEKQNADRLKFLNETERHALAIAEIERKSSKEVLDIRIKFQKDRIAILNSAPELDKAAIRQARNELNELERQSAKIRIDSLASLQEKQGKLMAALQNDLVRGSEEYRRTLDELRTTGEKIKEIQKDFDFPEKFTEGSLKFLQQQASKLQEQLELMNSSDANFDPFIQKLKEVNFQIDELNRQIEGEDQGNRVSTLGEQLSEEERHAGAMLAIKQKQQQDTLKINKGTAAEQLALQNQQQEEEIALQVKFAREKLEVLLAEDKFTGVERLAAENQLTELLAEQERIRTKNTKEQAELRREELKKELKDVFNAAVQFANAYLSLKISESNNAIKIQSERVKEAEKIASRGNAEILQLEQERLDKLNKQRADFVKKQQALAQIQLVTSSLLAVAKAAETGGPLAAVTIAATLLALAAGLAQARATAQAASFKKGGIYKPEGGFTGYGPPDGQATGVGWRPYIYHNQEHIMPAGVTMLGDNMKWLEKIRMQRLNIGDLINSQKTIVNIPPRDDRELIEAIRNLGSTTSIYFDPDGVIKTVTRNAKNIRRTKKKIG